MNTATPDERPPGLSLDVLEVARQIDALPAEHRAVLLSVIRFEVVRMRLRRGRVEAATPRRSA